MSYSGTEPGTIEPRAVTQTTVPGRTPPPTYHPPLPSTTRTIHPFFVYWASETSKSLPKKCQWDPYGKGNREHRKLSLPTHTLPKTKFIHTLNAFICSCKNVNSIAFEHIALLKTYFIWVSAIISSWLFYMSDKIVL